MTIHIPREVIDWFGYVADRPLGFWLWAYAAASYALFFAGSRRIYRRMATNNIWGKELPPISLSLTAGMIFAPVVIPLLLYRLFYTAGTVKQPEAKLEVKMETKQPEAKQPEMKMKPDFVLCCFDTENNWGATCLRPVGHGGKCLGFVNNDQIRGAALSWSKDKKMGGGTYA